MEQSKIIKRNFLFWGKYGIQMTAILIGFVVVYGIFFSFGDSSDGGFWTSANYFAILIGILFNYIGPMSDGGTDIPMVLSFGSGSTADALWKKRNGIWNLNNSCSHSFYRCWFCYGKRFDRYAYRMDRKSVRQGYFGSTFCRCSSGNCTLCNQSYPAASCGIEV